MEKSQEAPGFGAAQKQKLTDSATSARAELDALVPAVEDALQAIDRRPIRWYLLGNERDFPD